MDIPTEEDEAIATAKGAEVPADKMRNVEPSKKQLDGGPLEDATLRALKSGADDGELWLVSKKTLAAGEFPLKHVPGGKVTMGKDWIRTDGDSCEEAPGHLYVVANR